MPKGGSDRPFSPERTAGVFDVAAVANSRRRHLEGMIVLDENIWGHAERGWDVEKIDEYNRVESYGGGPPPQRLGIIDGLLLFLPMGIEMLKTEVPLAEGRGRIAV